MGMHKHAVLAAMAWLAMAGAAPARAADDDRVAGAWRDFLATAERESVYAAYSAVLEIEDENGDLSAEACRRHAGALEDAVARVPVGLTIHYIAYRCAEQVGDDAAAERHVAWFGALARHALASAPEPEDWVGAPIRIVAGRDIYTLLEASGLEFRGQWFEVAPRRRHLVLQVAAWDPEAEREQLLAFDFTDTAIRLERKDARAPYPGFRKVYQDGVIESFVELRQVAGLDLDAVRRAHRSDELAEKITLLRPIAEQGGVNAATAWLETCHASPEPGCGEGLVDALLPSAEEGHVAQTVLLALAHALGVGVEKDEAAAMTLLDAAERASGRKGRAVVDYARRMYGLDLEYTPALLQRLQAAEASGNPLAAVILAAGVGRKPTGEDPDVWPDEAVARVRALAEAGAPVAVAAMADQMHRRSEDAETVAWLQRAADLGDADAQDLLARYLREGRGLPRDLGRSLALHREAAAGGNTDAMLTLGWRAWGEDNEAAEYWFLSASMYGRQEGTLELAQLYLDAAAGDEGKRKEGLRLLERLDQDADSAAARRLLAGAYLRGQGVGKDVEKARRYFLQDAEAGDADSQIQLGVALAEGAFGKPERDAGVAWLEKAIAAGSLEAHDALAYFYYYEGDGEADRRRALGLWRKARAAGGGDDVLNNLAWVLCTSPHADTYSPEEGGQVAAGMEAVAPLANPSYIDTVAACHAAGKRFDDAVARQQEAIALLEEIDAKDDSLEGMRERLAQYRAGERHVEAEAP